VKKINIKSKSISQYCIAAVSIAEMFVESQSFLRAFSLTDNPCEIVII